MKPPNEGRGLSKVRVRTGLEVRGGHRCGRGLVGGKFRLGGVRGWQFWGRDEQPGGLEIRCCRLRLVSGLRGPDVLLTAYVDASNAIYGQELSCVGAMRLGGVEGRHSHPMGSRKGGPDCFWGTYLRFQFS